MDDAHFFIVDEDSTFDEYTNMHNGSRERESNANSLLEIETIHSATMSVSPIRHQEQIFKFLSKHLINNL